MRFGSVCSGIEAASVAFAPLGWKAAWFAEIEPFPCAVLQHRFPEVPNLGDMTALPQRILSGEVEAPDLLCGGTPCQAFSVAGVRKSLEDDRGNLTLTFCEIANAIDSVRTSAGKPGAIILWENVPGVLATKDNAFGCFLGRLCGTDFPLLSNSARWPSAGVVVGPKRKVSWRILDAQYFGVPQRRRRVFVVASPASERFDPSKVLFECQSVHGDHPPRRSQGEGTPADPDGSTGTTGQVNKSTLWNMTLKSGEVRPADISGTVCAHWDNCTDTPLVSETAVYDMTHACDVIRESRQCPTLEARMGTGGNQVPLILDDRESTDDN